MYTPGPDTRLLSPIEGIDRLTPNSGIDELPESDSEGDSVIQTPIYTRPRWAVANPPPNLPPSPSPVRDPTFSPLAQVASPSAARDPSPIIMRMRDISFVDLSGDTDDEMDVQPVQQRKIRVLSEDTVDDSDDDEPPMRLSDLITRPLFATPSTALSPPGLPTPPPSARKSITTPIRRRRTSQACSSNRHRPPTASSSSARASAGNHRIGPFSNQEDLMIYRNINTDKSWQPIAIRLNRPTRVSFHCPSGVNL
jgi:hypothetical protein